jgi:hypothetical protein
MALKELSVVSELMSFLWMKKKYWLVPVLLALVLLGLMLSITANSALAPFIYTLF